MIDNMIHRTIQLFLQFFLHLSVYIVYIVDPCWNQRHAMQINVSVKIHSCVLCGVLDMNPNFPQWPVSSYDRRGGEGGGYDTKGRG